MNSVFDTLTAAQQIAVMNAVRQCRNINSHVAVTMPDGGEAYAYPHPGGGIAWGFNGGEHGVCIARGVVEG